MEIAGLTPEHEVRNEASARGHVLAKLHIFLGKQCKPAEGVNCQQYYHQGWEDSFSTAGVELNKTEGSPLKILK